MNLEIESHKYAQMIFDRDAKAIQWRKEVSHQMALKKWDSVSNNNNTKMNLDLSLNLMQKLIKNRS